MRIHRQKGRITAAFGTLCMLFLAGPATADMPELADDRRDEVEQMSARQLTDQAEANLKEMRQLLQEVMRMLDEARDEKDVVKLNCVNEKLTHIRGLVRVSEESQVSLQEAIAVEEMEEARHEFTKILVARDRVRQLRAEAEECVGQLAFLVDEDLEVEVEVPDLPDGVTDMTPMPPAAVRPPMASPVR